ncbi:MAG TPA: hypothetical protein VND93_17785 [Myxococcales bacterium]|nr:hypothetical protein [Myxococcales bacterium]
MTTISTAAALTLARANTQPLAAAARPDLQRTLSAPAALGSPAAQSLASRPPVVPPSVSASWLKDGFSRAGSAVKGWHDGAVKTATEGARTSGTAFGGLKAAGGLAGGVFGVVSNATGLAGAIKNHEGGQAIAANVLGLSRGTLGTVKGGLDTAAAIESGLAKVAKGADAAAHVAEGAGAALRVGAEGAGVAGRLAGRFAPGLNIAIAGVDTAIAARTLADSHSSIASKVTTSITAAGSVVAATNIPIVSQVGAAVSTASSLTGVALNHLGDIKDGFHKLGDKLKHLF